MYSIDQRISMIESKISAPDFLKNKGLGNEVGYYIFDYPPEYELAVRDRIMYLKTKYSPGKNGFHIVEFDIYEIIYSILEERKYVDPCYELEKTEGFDYATNAIITTLRLTEDSNLLINYIVERTPENCVVFLTGVGKCYPIVRSHNVLNNLHQVLDTVPVVMFYPGEYSGQGLKLFGTSKDDNYYRAFRLV